MSRPVLDVTDTQRRDIDAILDGYLLLVEFYTDEPTADGEPFHGPSYIKGYHAAARRAYMQAVKDIREALR